MYVADLMSRKLYTVAPQDSVETAVRQLRQRGVRHLLVVSKGRLVGILSDRDLKRAMDPGKVKKTKLAAAGFEDTLSENEFPGAPASSPSAAPKSPVKRRPIVLPPM